MDIDTLKEKVASAEAKVEKCKGTIARHEAQLVKRIEKAKALGCPIAVGDAAELTNYWLSHNQSDFTNEQVWAIIDANFKFGDIRGAQGKLVDAERILDNWQAKLDAEIEKERLIEENCPQVIKDFLEQWKLNCTLYYESKYNEWPEFVEKLRAEEKQARIDCLREVTEKGAAQFIMENGLYDAMWSRRSLYMADVSDDVKASKCHAITEAYTKEWTRYCENKDSSMADYMLNNVYPHSLMDAYLTKVGLDWKGINARRREFGGELLLKMVEFRDDKQAFDFLDITLEEEKKAKIIDMMARIEGITGEIVDAGYLHIGPKGDLEGVIIGEQGKAKINTIGAGGYNIQCYHYRTLIHELKEKDLASVLADAKNRSAESGSSVEEPKQLSNDYVR